MLNISQFILEKLHLGKDIQMSATLISKAENADVSKQYKYSWDWPDNKDIMKMEAYKNKGSKPERLVATIKDRGKLERRFRVAVSLKWEDAINVFGQAIIDRNIHPEEDVLIYIKRFYIDKK